MGADLKTIFAGAVLATAAVLLAGSAGAAVYTSDLEYRDAGNSTYSKSATPFGQVRIEDGFDYGKAVKVTVTLTDPNSLFVNTGGPHEPFLFNLQNDGAVDIRNALGQNFYDGGRMVPAGFEATPFGMFTNKIGCCSNWVEAQDVVSGFHWETQTTTEQVITGYQILTYEVKGYPISGYEQKLDKNGKPLFDKKGNPVYDNSQPIYDYAHPIYNYSKPLYDYSKPIYTTKTTTTKVKVLDYKHVEAHWEEKNGSANGIKGPLTFYVRDQNGITFAGKGATFDQSTGRLLSTGSGADNHFFSNPGKWWFTADICDAKAVGACTYNVAARDAFGTFAVPEPATWGLMILGFFGVGGAIRRRRAALA